jgi:cellulose synthase/poly-beta-1,6-N-acetylglucosamine synthase-like glycosyltransferase
LRTIEMSASVQQVNQGYRSSNATYLATLNDDAVADSHWLEKLVSAAEARPRAGMFASEVRLTGTQMLDSAGMLVASDGSSKQRGHGENPASYSSAHDALFPSGSAAMYRRTMLQEIGLFDESYFLYCEDTDLGLRGRWAGWECAYVPGAVANIAIRIRRDGRLRSRRTWSSAIASLPCSRTFRSACGPARASRHTSAIGGTPCRCFGAAARPPSFAIKAIPHGNCRCSSVRAHFAAFASFPRLWREHRRIRASRRISIAEFRALLAQHTISVRKVAEL